MFVSYKIENDKAVSDAIKDALSLVGSLKTPFKMLSVSFYKQMKKHFSLQSSGQYPALSDKYRKRKEVLFPGRPILVASGRLMSSVTTPDNIDSVLKIEDTYMLIGTKVISKKGAPYPIYLQEGTKNMPMRKYLFIDDTFRDQVINTLNAWVKKSLSRVAK